MIIAGTGHRPNKLGGYSAETEDAIISTAIAALQKLNPAKVIMGGALGWDQCLGWAAVSLNIPVVAALPFQHFDAPWPSHSREKLASLLKQCAEVHYICPPGYAASKLQTRNKWMVDHCDVVLALWDGSAGGTRNCIAYAHEAKRPVKNAWRLYRTTTRCAA